MKEHLNSVLFLRAVQLARPIIMEHTSVSNTCSMCLTEPIPKVTQDELCAFSFAHKLASADTNVSPTHSLNLPSQ